MPFNIYETSERLNAEEMELIRDVFEPYLPDLMENFQPAAKKHPVFAEEFNTLAAMALILDENKGLPFDLVSSEGATAKIMHIIGTLDHAAKTDPDMQSVLYQAMEKTFPRFFELLVDNPTLGKKILGPSVSFTRH